MIQVHNTEELLFIVQPHSNRVQRWNQMMNYTHRWITRRTTVVLGDNEYVPPQARRLKATRYGAKANEYA